MKFSNGTRVSSGSERRQGLVSVEWQSVVLGDGAVSSEPGGSSPSGDWYSSVAERDAKLRDAKRVDMVATGFVTNGFVGSGPMQGNTQMALTLRDDLLGVPVAAAENRQNAHAITLHSQPLHGQPLYSQPVGEPLGLSPANPGLALSSESVSEVVSLYMRQADAYCDEGQWEKAFHACQEALKVAPATAEAYKFLGKILQQQGQPTDAMGFYAKAITLRPNYPEVYSNLGSLYAQKGEWEEAVSYYKKAIERDPELAIAYLNLAKIWKRLGRKDSELNCRATAFRLQPDLGSAEEHFKLAQTLEAAGNAEGAVLFYQEATKQDPKMVAAYQRLADLLEDGGDWQGAAECYRKVLSLNAEAEKASQASPPSIAEVTQNLSPQSQQQLQQLLQASKTKKLVNAEGAAGLGAEPSATPQLSLSPAEAAQLSPTELSQRYAAVKDWGRAIEHMQAAIAQEPQSAILYRSLAKLFEQSGNAERAAGAWYRSFVLDPSWPDAQQCYSLGRVLARNGNTEAAIRCYQHSVRLQPDFSPPREALEQLQSTVGGNVPFQDSSIQNNNAFSQQVIGASKKW